MSPLNLIPSGSFFGDPPKSKQAIAFLISLCPNIAEAILLEIFSNI
jgi:hypothetical protein